MIDIKLFVEEDNTKFTIEPTNCSVAEIGLCLLAMEKLKGELLALQHGDILIRK